MQFKNYDLGPTAVTLVLTCCNFILCTYNIHIKRIYNTILVCKWDSEESHLTYVNADFFFILGELSIML